MTNKKILMISTTDNMIWQFMIPHIKHLQELGNQVEIVCSKTGFWFDELKDKYNFITHDINFARNPLNPKNLSGYKKLVKLQKENNYDLIYCQQPVGGLMGRLLGKKFKLPVIYTAHGFHFFKGCPLKNKLIYKPVEKYLSKYTTALITINEEDFISAKKLKAKNVYKINGIGIDTTKLKNERFDTEKFKQELGLSSSDKVVLTISEINQNKNYITMLKTIKDLVSHDKSIKFVSCGTGIWENKIKSYAKELGIENNCLFLGYRKDIDKILQITDIFLHASFREGLTLSVLEAMSYGVPCVVSNVRGNRDLIINEKGGFVVSPEDYRGFSNKIQQLLSDPILRKSYGSFNKQESEKYKVENVKKELEKIYIYI